MNPNLKTKRIIVTGGSGFIGAQLVRALANLNHVSVVATYFEQAALIPADLRARNAGKVEWVKLSLAEEAQSVDSLVKIFGVGKCDLVLHCAALANLAVAESAPELAERVNVVATRSFAEYAKQCGGRLVFFSTDQVFDGESSWYGEQNAVGPINEYARSKVRAEAVVREIMPPGRGVSLRVSLVYGASPSGTRSASEQILAGFAGTDPRRLFVDEFRTPTYVGDIVQVVGRLRGLQVAGEDWPGLLHIAGLERVSRYEFGCLIAEIFGLAAGRLERIKQADLDLGMPRPGDLSLAIDLAQELIGFAPRTLAEGLRDWRANRGEK